MPSVLISRAGGYALRLGKGALDAVEAERLHGEARSARGRGDLESAVRLLREAEELWEGTPLTGVPGDYAQRQRDRLTEYRLDLVETRLDLELQLGRHAGIAGELSRLADEHPLREGLRALQMLALYRCGRQAEALDGYARARRVLAEELGIDPGPDLVRLHQRILESDTALLVAPQAVSAHSPPRDPAAESVHPSWVPPAQMPPDAPDFTGRSEQAAIVCDALAGAVREQATAPVICVIHGMGGVGKTTLAVHAAHTVLDAFPGGQLYADLRGAGGEPADPYEVQDSFLRALGVASGNVPVGRDDRTALYRSRLSGRRMLLLLDNAAGTEQVASLLPSTGGCGALVTSRKPLISLPTTSRIALGPFSEQEALTLLQRIAGTDRCRREQQAAQELVQACGMLPLAVRIVAGRLAVRPRWSLSAMAARVGDRAQRLTELETGGSAVESVFQLGYSALDADQARAFRLLAIPETDDISSAVAAAVLGCDPRAAEVMLESLAHVGLLEPGDPGRYRYHDLLRLFARHRTLDTDSCATRGDVLSRTAWFYLSGMSAAMRVEWPRSILPGAVAPEATPGGPAISDEAHAQEWVINELPAMLAVAAQILNHSYRPVSAQDTRTLAGLLVLLTPYTDLCIPWPSLDGLAHKLLDAAERHGDQAAVVYSCVVAAIARGRTGQHEDARALARRAYEAPHPMDRALSHRLVFTMGMVASMRPNGLGEAIDHYRRARKLSREAGDLGMAAQCSLGLTQALLVLAQPHAALEAAREAVDLCRAVDSPAGVALAQRGLGEALAALGRHDEAIAECHAAFDVCQTHGLHTQRARTLLSCAVTLTDAGRLQQAATFAALARTALAQLGDTAGEERAQALLNRLEAGAES